MNIRKANINDINNIMIIIDQAKTYLKDNNIDQWQDGYPNVDSIKNDISNHNSYVLESNNGIIATSMISDDIESTYNHIEDGNWLSNGKYAVIHRIAIRDAQKGNGIAGIMIDYVSSLFKDIKSIRVDTHIDNLSMQRLLLKHGFEYCGIIYLTDGKKRNAYEKLL